MGEYWKIANVTRREIIEPGDYGYGIKLHGTLEGRQRLWNRIDQLITIGEWSSDDDIRLVSDYRGSVQICGKRGPDPELTSEADCIWDCAWPAR